MVLKTYNIGRRGQIVLSDDASDKDIYDAMYIDATVPQGNDGRVKKAEEPNDKRSKL